MRPDVARRPRHAASTRTASALLSAVLLIAFVAIPAPPEVLASTPMAAACDGVRLRSGPSTSEAQVTTINAGSQVTVETTLIGGAWSATCAGNAVSGDGWHQISEVDGLSVLSLFGVSSVYAATGLFGPAAVPTPTPTPSPTPTPDPFATPTPTPDPFATPTPTPTPFPSPSPTPTPFLPVTEGIDVSHWQNTIDWSRVAASGKRFAYMKASEGTTLVDQTYASNRAQAKAYGLLVGAYHFARPNRTPGDAIAEADYFLAMSQVAAGDLLPVLDLEVNGGLAPVELQEWVKSYLGRIYERTGARGVIYTSPTFWRNSMADTNWFAANGYRTLWIAHWTSGPAPSLPAGNWGGTGWTFWQYTSSGTVPGISGRVDLNRFNGTDLAPVLLTNGVLDPTGQTATLNVTPSSTVITWGDTVVIKSSFGSAGGGPDVRVAGGPRRRHLGDHRDADDRCGRQRLVLLPAGEQPVLPGCVRWRAGSRASDEQHGSRGRPADRTAPSDHEWFDEGGQPRPAGDVHDDGAAVARGLADRQGDPCRLPARQRPLDTLHDAGYLRQRRRRGVVHVEVHGTR